MDDLFDFLLASQRGGGGGAVINGGVSIPRVKAMTNIEKGDTGIIFTENYSKLPNVKSMGNNFGNRKRCCWSPNGTKIAFCGASQFCVLDATSVPFEIIDIYNFEAFACAWSPDGTRLVAVGTGMNNQNPIRIYDTSNVPYTLLEAPTELTSYDCFACAWSPDGKKLTIGGTFPEHISVYDTTSIPYAKISAPADLPGEVQCCAYSPDGSFLAVGHAISPFIAIYDTSTVPYTKISDPQSSPTHTVSGCAWHPNGTRLALCGASFLCSYAVPSWSFANHTPQYGNPTGCAWSPDGSLFCVATRRQPNVGGGWIYSAQIKQGNNIGNSVDTIILPQNQPFGGCGDCAWSPDGKMLVLTQDIISYGLVGYIVVGDTPLIYKTDKNCSGANGAYLGYSSTNTAKGDIGKAVALFKP